MIGLLYYFEDYIILYFEYFVLITKKYYIIYRYRNYISILYIYNRLNHLLNKSLETICFSSYVNLSKEFK